MKVFLSYAWEDKDIAEQVNLALVGAGCEVFFDQTSLTPASDFNSRIRQSVRDSDLFIFLVSPDSVAKSAYALTELKFAQEKWPHPKDYVLPVMVRATKFEVIPNYLKAVTVLEPAGSVAAEVSSWVSERLNAGDVGLWAKLRKWVRGNKRIAWWSFLTILAIGVAIRLLLVSPKSTSPPKADFTVSPSSTTSGTAPIGVQFRDMTINVLPNTTIRREWDFGDGQTSTRRNPFHTYTEAGVYTVKLTVTDNRGGSSTEEKPEFIRVEVDKKPPPPPPPPPPGIPPLKADFIVSCNHGIAPLRVQFDDTTNVPYVDIAKREWIFGDDESSNALNPSHIYKRRGTYTVRLTVVDKYGRADTTEKHECIKTIDTRSMSGAKVPSSGYFDCPEPFVLNFLYFSSGSCRTSRE
jgi:PKD repeat protein